MKWHAFQYFGAYIIPLAIICFIWLLVASLVKKDLWKDEKFQSAIWDFIVAGIILLVFYYFGSK